MDTGIGERFVFSVCFHVAIAQRQIRHIALIEGVEHAFLWVSFLVRDTQLYFHFNSNSSPASYSHYYERRVHQCHRCRNRGGGAFFEYILLLLAPIHNKK